MFINSQQTRANRYCRFCKVPKIVGQYATTVDITALRTEFNWAADIETNDFQLSCPKSPYIA